jgi:hypothetical protein
MAKLVILRASQAGFSTSGWMSELLNGYEDCLCFRSRGETKSSIRVNEGEPNPSIAKVYQQGRTRILNTHNAKVTASLAIDSPQYAFVSRQACHGHANSDVIQNALCGTIDACGPQFKLGWTIDREGGSQF